MSTELATMPRTSRMTDVIEVVQHLDQLWNLADILVRSRMLPESIRTPEAAVAIMLKGRELGIGTMAAFSGITVIQGKPTVSPQLMLALINRSGLQEDMRIEDDGQCCYVTMKRSGRDPHTASFSMEDARNMKLATKDNYLKQPAVMRQWRAVAACSRVVFPDVIDGLYTHEEMGLDVNEDGEVIEAEVVPPPAIARQAESPTKRGSGLFTKEHVEVTARFNEWISKKCAATNDAWLAEWEEKIAAALDSGLAVPSKVEDVINPWQAKGHLLKWAIETERLDPSIVPEDSRTRQTDALVALVYWQSDEDRAALKAEMGQYVARQRQLKAEVIYRKNPDLAPAGFAEEQREALDSEDRDEPEVTDLDGEVLELMDNPVDLAAWLREQEAARDVGVFKYIKGWAKLQDYPLAIQKWTPEQTRLAHMEAIRKLAAISNEKVGEMVAASPEPPWEDGRE